MSLRQRGEEIAIRFVKDGTPMVGSWLKVQDFEVTPQQDLKETDFLGETETDYDRQHHGYGIAWTWHNLDASLVAYLDEIVDAEANHQAPEDLRVQVMYSFRDPTKRPLVVTYYNGVCRISSEGFRGRKEYVETKCEGRYQKRKTQQL